MVSENDKEFLKALGVREYSPEERAALEAECRRSTEEFIEDLKSRSYTESEVMSRLGCDKHQLESLIAERRLLVWHDPLDEKMSYFPKVQFGPNGAVLPWIKDILDRITFMEPDALGVTNFLTYPAPGYDGKSRIEAVLSEEHKLAWVLGEATGLGAF